MKRLKLLSPILPNLDISDQIEQEISKLLLNEVYLPLIGDLSIADQDTILENSLEEYPNLIKAIRSGRVRFYRGRFIGKFSARISRELSRAGAKYNRRQGSFDLLASALPKEIQRSILVSESNFSRMINLVSKKLEKISPEKIASKLDLDKMFSRDIYRIDGFIDEQLKGISVYNKFTDKQVAEIAKMYNDNMKLYIRGWLDDEIKELRSTVQAHVQTGMRYDNLAKEIEHSYGVSKSKAKFWARQETQLLSVEMQKQRYLDAGHDKYMWRNVVGSPNHPVRPYHKALNNKIFSWKNPPIVNAKGDRKHAGQDFNCRCRAIPVVYF